MPGGAHFAMSLSSFSDMSWTSSTMAQRANGFERQAGHQPFSIDVGVEKRAAEGIERLDHFKGRDRGNLAPAADGNLPGFRIDSEDELAFPEF